MLIYTDIISGDEFLSDSFEVEEFMGVFYKVPGKWTVQGVVEVDTGANASAEGGEDEGVDDSAVKVVDIVDTFRLQEQPSYDKKGFMAYMKKYIQKLTTLLPEERVDSFKAEVQAAVKFLVGKLSDLQFFLGESMDIEGGMVYAYYEDGATDPTFLYFKDGLKEVKC
eukprot:TRINITY_DN29913_c0_g1_i1.p1 TRINITY_DN29913_c0_g1~~TRINITY_DN29913_c0_g1_i1.p1  ORF type:complete len:167 (-),score=51.21 TRINITY_DN29913_c0_g1_i1:842-1342(-)